MHKGRFYPYLPQFWATECMFWPGHVPWKFLGVVNIAVSDGWENIDPDFDAVSVPGDPGIDAKVPTWSWALSAPSAADLLTLSIQKKAYAGVAYASWKASLWIGASRVAQAWFFQPSPLYICGTDGTQWRLTEDPSSSLDGPWLNFAPATYAQGGSPWS